MYRIFIVEDDAGLAQAMKKQIASWGNEVFCAEDFSDIIPAFVACEPHMVLMDIMRPFITAITGAAKSAESPTC